MEDKVRERKKYFHIVRSTDKLIFLKEFVDANKGAVHSATVLGTELRKTKDKIHEMFGNTLEFIPSDDVERISDEILESQKVFVW